MLRLNSILILSVCLFTSVFSDSRAQLSTAVPNLNNDIKIINNSREYKNTVKTDTSKQMIELQDFLTTFYVDFKYATTDNFTKKKLYKTPKAYLRLPAATALRNVCNDLKNKGLAIKIWDAYRPYDATKKMWKIVPDERYAANPAKGSNHNRGTAVDLTLVCLDTGEELPMPTVFDNFTEQAHHNYTALSAEVIANRHLLKTIMEQNGFVSLSTEWWHYSLPNSKMYEVLNFNFKKMKKLISSK